MMGFRTEVSLITQGATCMYTSILMVALSGMAPSAETRTPAWSLDYSEATRQAAQAHKPMAIFLAPGTGAYEKIGRGGGLGSIAQHILTEKYVCVHIDTSTSKGKKLAGAFQMAEGLGIVISDSKAENQ